MLRVTGKGAGPSSPLERHKVWLYGGMHTVTFSIPVKTIILAFANEQPACRHPGCGQHRRTYRASRDSQFVLLPRRADRRLAAVRMRDVSQEEQRVAQVPAGLDPVDVRRGAAPRR